MQLIKKRSTQIADGQTDGQKNGWTDRKLDALLNPVLR